jgi:zinc transporter, ZIP family
LSQPTTILLGAIAGFTIFLGLPMGRARTTSIRLKTFLSGISAGVLGFLAVEIFEHAFQGVEGALTAAHDHHGSWGRFGGMAAVYVIGIGAGLLALFYVMRALAPREKQSVGPGAMATSELDHAHHHRRREALHLGMSIAVAIGLHNFSEGLAIGQSAHRGDTTLALLLVIGFALHNATEGFGIVGPLVAADVRPAWSWLLLAGLVAGGPTFFGTIIGNSITSEYVFVAFLTLAAGAILYVIGELFSVGRKLSWEITLWGVLIGFLLGLGTELVIVAAGA